ncbi:hypothetical protein [Flavobacterium sp. W21_SRS_FM6]|uniref:hypothetical protein n=1 Tax=Flavobacterium sp. W21_SRS_FM6 TaxID=3240268 RepID=UPI003F91E97A
MAEKERISLPELQLLILFLCSSFFVLPSIVKGNLIGVITFSLIVVFYILSNLEWLKSTFDLSAKEISVYILMLSLCGYLAFEVFFLLSVLAVYPLSKFYK